MRLKTRSSALLVLFLQIVSSVGARAGSRPELDRLATMSATPASAQGLARAREEAGRRRLGTVAHAEERLGLPTFVWADRARATGPTPTSSRSPARVPESAARAHLERLAPVYGLDAAEARDALLRRVHDTGAGGVIATFGREVEGIEVFRDEMRVLMDRDLELVAIAGYLPSARLAARGGRAFGIDAPDAIEAALADFGAPVARRAIGAGRAAPGGYRTFEVAGAAVKPVRAKRVWFHLPESLEPAWYLELLGESESYSYVISASDRSVLFRHDLVASDSYGYRVWSDVAMPFSPHDGPQGTAPTPHPTGTPNSYAPPFTSPALVTIANGPISTSDPWLPPAATETIGNNVDAYADRFAPDGLTSGDFRASATSPGSFDRTYDVSLAPTANANQQMAAVTQLFFTNNFLHDWFYDSGFDEASGNAQASNFGRGGVEGDRLLAEGQDYSGVNNANMHTPADGASPRMQMYVFNHPTVGKLAITAPPSIAGDYAAAFANFAPSTFSVTADVVLVNDGAGTTSDACEAIVNSVAGKIALYDAGVCNAQSKAANAQAAGAVGAIHVHNVPGAPPPNLTGTPAVTIPVLPVSYETGQAIKASLGGGTVTATLGRQAQLSRDGTIDNQIVAHEWAHYLSNRLVGNGNGLTTQQAGGMGEGWSDFVSILLSVRPEDVLAPGNDQFQGVYAMAGYALSRSFFANNAYYFGIRRYPYSTDLAKNPLTFRHIENGVALPVGPPVAFGADGANNAAVHRTGEFWCNALWECYAALLRDSGRLTFDQARDRMRAYLVAGLKMTPVGPTLTEARDALLSVAYSADAADYALLCAAFARRGLGSGAVSPERYSTTHAGVVESFACGGALAFVEGTLEDDASSCDSDGYLDEGETGWLRITLRNVGSTSLGGTSASVTSTNPHVTFPDGPSVTFPSSTPYTEVTASIPVALAGASGIETMTFTIEYDDPGLLVAGPLAASVTTYANADEVPSSVETVETLSPPWTIGVGPISVLEYWRRSEVSPASHRFFAPDPGGQGDLLLTSPPLQVGVSESFGFSFVHAFSFETGGGVYYDGGVIEISDDDGATWTDIGSAAAPGYGGSLYASSGNPIGGRPAFVGQSPGYPALQPVIVDLGTTYAGETVRVRFRLGADVAVNGPGWQIDDLEFVNLVGLPFAALVAEADSCANPVAVGDVPALEWSLALEGSHPVEGRARFRFTLPAHARVALAIYDVTGRRIATPASDEFGAGVHAVTWEPAATSAPAGVYFACLEAGGRRMTRRFVVAR